MLSKIKIISLQILAFSLLMTNGLALADTANPTVCTSSGGSIPTCSTAVNSVNDPCHPESSVVQGENGPITYNPLTTQQVTSCENCRSQNLKPDVTKATVDQTALVTCLQSNVLIKDLNAIVNVLGGLVGIVVVANIIIGGIQYSMSTGKPDSTSASKKRIMQALVALAAYMLIFGFLEWLIPGGVLN